MNLKDNLKRLRKDNNISQEELAEKLGVSRQSVSKWESGAAYPEMDKMLQICNIFSISIDDLLNQDIKEVNNTKESKKTVNRYFDDFLNFITKTVDMFTSMKFGQQLKCLFEQFVIIGIVSFILFVIFQILEQAIFDILILLPENIYSATTGILSTVYLLFAIGLTLVITIHIFKTRYLDYYEIVDADEVQINDDTKVIEEKEKKIIIRDPKDSEYRIVKGLLKVILFTIKLFALFLAFFFVMTLIFFAGSLVVSFAFIRTGLTFVGALIAIVSAIIINIVFLIVLFNFIFSRKTKKGFMLIIFLTSVITFGVGCGLVFVDIPNYKLDATTDDSAFIVEEKTIEMRDDLIINSHYNVNFIESNNKDIRIVMKYPKYYKGIMYENNNVYNFYLVNEDGTDYEIFKKNINNLKDKKFVDYYNFKVDIYTNKDNIIKLTQNNDRCYCE